MVENSFALKRQVAGSYRRFLPVGIKAEKEIKMKKVT